MKRNERTEQIWQEMTSREKILFSMYRQCVRILDSIRNKPETEKEEA